MNICEFGHAICSLARQLFAKIGTPVSTKLLRYDSEAYQKAKVWCKYQMFRAGFFLRIQWQKGILS